MAPSSMAGPPVVAGRGAPAVCQVARWRRRPGLSMKMTPASTSRIRLTGVYVRGLYRRPLEVLMSVLEGGCACGAVRYRLTSAPMFVNCCHCTDCQRQVGSAFVINALI